MLDRNLLLNVLALELVNFTDEVVMPFGFGEGAKGLIAIQYLTRTYMGTEQV